MCYIKTIKRNRAISEKMYLKNPNLLLCIRTDTYVYMHAHICLILYIFSANHFLVEF